MFRRMVYLLSKLHVFGSHVSLVTAIALKTNIFAQPARLSFTLYMKLTHLKMLRVFPSHIAISRPGQRGRYSRSLRAEGYGDRIPVRARFFVTVQNAPAIQPASCTKVLGSFSEGNTAGA
jgi:hypothetical protein